MCSMSEFKYCEIMRQYFLTSPPELHNASEENPDVMELVKLNNTNILLPRFPVNKIRE